MTMLGLSFQLVLLWNSPVESTKLGIRDSKPAELGNPRDRLLKHNPNKLFKTL
jgi:hypothetical protein